jgi:hypothetical protein
MKWKILMNSWERNPKKNQAGIVGKYEWMLVLNKLLDYQY